MVKNFFSILVIVIFLSFKITGQQIIAAKEIQQNMTMVNDSLYVGKYEISNFDYRKFLNYTQKYHPDLSNKYAIDSLKWLQVMSYCEPLEPLSKYYHRHPTFNNYPVVNIPYEGATAYCDWLAEQYNNDSRRKFKKVKFTLPTEREWVIAAQGGKKEIIYPWGGNYLRNKQGMFMCNFKHVGDGFVVSDSLGNPVFDYKELEKNKSELGERAFYTASVDSFWPNSIGLYNMSGNVAEMTIQKGLTKGGSWNSYGGEITIQYKKFFYEPSPEVGFRIFMKVIER